MATADTLPNLLDIDQRAAHLGICHRHVRRLIAERRIPYVKVGRLVRFGPNDIATWVDRRRVADTHSL